MTLDEEDIIAIATEIVRQMRRLDGIWSDQQHLASLPIQEQKRLSQIRMRQYKAELKKGKTSKP